MAKEHANKNGRSLATVPNRPMWRPNTQRGDTCHWDDIDAIGIRSLIDAVTRAGGAVMFGLTADGGAYSLCILQDDKKIKEYPHGKEECEETQREIARYYAENEL